jgi:hypothetical protein
VCLSGRKEKQVDRLSQHQSQAGKTRGKNSRSYDFHTPMTSAEGTEDIRVVLRPLLNKSERDTQITM